ncbi:hypothetical protein [Desulfonema ishimotonii]|uniref:hypothetical protein n=1 Tax=Desulfonema ishimotonii TaxID=45657 RepID=UPI000F580017|nr:hypothetical protein [Desulfonema ishimotonii]
MFKTIISFAAGFAAAKLFTDSEPFAKVRNVIERCSDVIREEFGPKNVKEDETEEKTEAQKP